MGWMAGVGFVECDGLMRRFKSAIQAQRFLGVHAAVYNLFKLGRNLVRAEHYRNLRESAFAEWSRAVA